MKIKYSFSAILGVLILFSISQIFFIPPYAGDIFTIYKSGYFRELDRGFLVIKEAFFGVKTMGRPVYGWIFLEDVQKNQGITVRVYDRLGRRVMAPGSYSAERDGDILKAMASMDSGIQGSLKGGRYHGVQQLRCEDRCGICHRECREGLVIGAIAFDRDYDARVYYSSERGIIFLTIAAVLCIILFFVLRWDPGRNIKELFDK